MINIPAIISTNTTITNVIQIGANTHNQDHVITPVNFNAINRIASSPVNPIPELVVDLLSDISLNLKLSKREDSNLQPLAPKASHLTN